MSRSSWSASTMIPGGWGATWAFYIDRGTIRYEARSLEPHGDTEARITWYIDELKR